MPPSGPSSGKSKEAAGKALLEHFQSFGGIEELKKNGFTPEMLLHGKEDLSMEDLAKMIHEGQDFKKFRTEDKRAKQKQYKLFQEYLANFPKQMQEPGRSLEELLKSTDKITPAEAITLGEHAQGRSLKPTETNDLMSNILFMGDTWLMGKMMGEDVAKAAETLRPKYGDIYFDSTVPYPEAKAEAVKIVAERYSKYHEGDLNESLFQLLWKAVLLRQDRKAPDEVHRVKETFATTELLIQHGVPVDETDFIGNTALMYATGCLNPDLMSNVKFAELMLRGGADINHRSRQGHTALSVAAASRVTYGEDKKRAVPVKWLLEHGANPDVPDNSGFTARMNAQYSKVMTKLIRDEDKRREELPPHCVFCLYIPPEDFTPGKESVGGGPYLLKDKEPPRPLMSCPCKSKKAVYCSKKCQKGDWRHHKLSCKATKA